MRTSEEMVCSFCKLPTIPMGAEDVCMGHPDLFDDENDGEPDDSEDGWDYEGGDIDGNL